MCGVDEIEPAGGRTWRLSVKKGVSGLPEQEAFELGPNRGEGMLHTAGYLGKEQSGEGMQDGGSECGLREES